MGRVANLLLDLHRRVVAQCGANGPTLHLPINQIHIADATGLTSVHVCRTLKQLRLERLLEFNKGQLVLLDPERLAEIAQLDPEVRPYDPPPLAVA
jgi:CRP-like cAMP-binding protein